MSDSLEGFILTRQWRDAREGVEFEFWLATSEGPARVIVTGQEPVFFVERSSEGIAEARREPLELKNFAGRAMDGLYFKGERTLRDARDRLRAKGVQTYESDVKPEDRYLMERFIRGGCVIEGVPERKGRILEIKDPVMKRAEVSPSFSVVSLDIETAGLSGELYSIAVAGPEVEHVFMVGELPDSEGIDYCPDERALLEAFLAWMVAKDPDLIIGWNVVDFDLMFLQRKCKEVGIPFSLGRDCKRADIVPPSIPRQLAIARVPGRMVLDGIQLLRLGFWSFERYGLDYVAQEMLGRQKLIQETEDAKVDEIRRMFREDKAALAAYNLEDCRLVLEIFDHADLVGFATERAKLTGLALDRQGGSVAAVDFLYLPRLHRAGYVAPDLGSVEEPVASPGGYVMDSAPGLYDNVLVLDFKSLYPSIILTFKIDPLGMAVPGADPIPGFRGATFSREGHILPGLIEEMWTARDDAKRRNNTPLSTAIKIIMNSFYGVLGSPGCRFYHPNLASSITLRGHDLITRSQDFIEQQGYKVIYGDTDSLFVLVGSDVGEEEVRGVGDSLANGLNAWWKETLRGEFDLESFLEVEFETHYIRFFMPTIRGSEKGSKKRYAGYVRNAGGEFEMQFKGLESVRTDWTPLAREFQRELYHRIFFNEPYEDYVREVAADLLDGKYDDKLMYRKRLRRKLDEYTKNVPPHVQAARKLDKARRWVSYAITLNGPEPAEKLQSPFDYAHYLDRQLAPVADSILHIFNQSFEKLTGNQLEMF